MYAETRRSGRAGLALLVASATCCRAAQNDQVDLPRTDAALYALIQFPDNAAPIVHGPYAKEDSATRVAIDDDGEIYLIALDGAAITEAAPDADLELLGQASLELGSESCLAGRYTEAAVRVPFPAEADKWRYSSERGFVAAEPDARLDELLRNSALRLARRNLRCPLAATMDVVQFSASLLNIPADESRLRTIELASADLAVARSGHTIFVFPRGGQPRGFNIFERVDPAFIVPGSSLGQLSVKPILGRPGHFRFAAGMGVGGVTGLLIQGELSETDLIIDRLTPNSSPVSLTRFEEDGSVLAVGALNIARVVSGTITEARAFEPPFRARSFGDHPSEGIQHIIGGASGNILEGDAFGNLAPRLLGTEGTFVDSSVTAFAYPTVGIPGDLIAFTLSLGTFRRDRQGRFPRYEIFGEEEVSQCGGASNVCGRHRVRGNTPESILRGDGKTIVLAVHGCTHAALHDLESRCTSMVPRTGVPLGQSDEDSFLASARLGDVTVLMTRSEVYELID